MDSSCPREGGAMKRVILKVGVALVLSATGVIFAREVSAMEEELKRGQDLVIVYSKLVGEIQELRSKNRLLEGEAKKLRIRVKQLHRVVNQKSRKSVKKLLKCIHELGKKNNFVKELEGQVKGLKANLDLLQEEKEVYMKSSEMVSVEEHRRVLEENEDLNTEVSYLRWINSCLRKELMRNGTKYDGALALTVVADGHHEWGKKLMKNLKRCVGGHSGTVEPDEEGMFHSRRSCSSV
ncbi:uncharacterized protein LOC103857708 [Brassica rapa]|uniref:uncharacterized protein LOC103857708 n=1 Tax=Brassica campestris TaxID=3711 RepID=UPI00142E3EF6|nr:uncharacterized protein LOC103857708 [Brassica rapa]